MIYAMFNAMEIFGFYIKVIQKGAKINSMDMDIKKHLYNLHKDNGTFKDFSDAGKLYIRNGERVYVLSETSEGLYQSFYTDEVFESLAEFSLVNLNDHCESMESQLNQTLEYLGNHMENDQVMFLGFTMNDDMVSSAVSTLFTLLYLMFD